MGPIRKGLYYKIGLSFLLALSSGVAKGEFDFLRWLRLEQERAVQRMFENISPPGTRPGVVVASPSRSGPNYFRHWTRDAALIMDIVVRLYEKETRADVKDRYLKVLLQYVDFSRETQLHDIWLLGEPVFEPDGRPVQEEWGRPQNDGPAIRAVTLAKFAMVLIREGKKELVKEKLYDGIIPSHTVLKADLEYIAHHGPFGFDLWEEECGNSFFTRMMQRKAFLTGAKVATEMGDASAAKFYHDIGKELEPWITKHWNEERGYIVTTLDWERGLDVKSSGLDSAVILAVLHGDTGDGFFSVIDDRVMATACKLQEAFARIYPINQVPGVPGLAMGRYPEDVWDGKHRSGEGHPWVLITNGFGEYYARVARKLKDGGIIEITKRNLDFFKLSVPSEAGALHAGMRIEAKDQLFERIIRGLTERGDSFFKRVIHHSREDGAFTELINRYSGYLQGVENLTWSCASFVAAAWERLELVL